MPQVRCHIHRSSASKLRPQCFFTPRELGLPPMCLLFTAALLYSGLSAMLHCFASPNTVNSSSLLGDQVRWRQCCTAIDSDNGSGIESSVGPPGIRGSRDTRSCSAEITRSRRGRVEENEAVERGAGGGYQHLSLSQWVVPECGSLVMRCHAICFHFGPADWHRQQLQLLWFQMWRRKKKIMSVAAFCRGEESCPSCTSLPMTWSPVRLPLQGNPTVQSTRSTHTLIQGLFSQFSSISRQVAAAGLQIWFPTNRLKPGVFCC